MLSAEEQYQANRLGQQCDLAIFTRKSARVCGVLGYAPATDLHAMAQRTALARRVRAQVHAMGASTC